MGDTSSTVIAPQQGQGEANLAPVVVTKEHGGHHGHGGHGYRYPEDKQWENFIATQNNTSALASAGRDTGFARESGTQHAATLREIGEARADVKGAVLTSACDVKGAVLSSACDIKEDVLTTRGDLRADIKDSALFLRKDICDLSKQVCDNEVAMVSGFKDAQGLAYQIEGRAAVQAEKHAAAGILEAVKNAAAANLEAQKNFAALSKQQAECCCELKELVTAQATQTRDLISANTLQDQRDRAQKAETALNSYLTARLIPVVPA